MVRTLSLIGAFVVLLCIASPALAAPHIPLKDWKAQPGDSFVVDTEADMGYLKHADGSYAVVYLGSGRRSFVSYAGSRYFAATPVGIAEVQSIHWQPKGATFGDGLFLRLYYWDDARKIYKHTKYGIHATSNIDWILRQEDRKKSMGCVLTDPAVLGHLLDAFELNGGRLKVELLYGFNESTLIAEAME